MPSLFLSYSHADKAFVHRLYNDLMQRGFQVWLDEVSIAPGALISESIEKGIEECAYFIVTLSPDSVKSAWVRQECALALTRACQEHGCAIVPILRKDCDIPDPFEERRHLDFREEENYHASFELLLKALPPSLPVFDAFDRDCDWEEGLYCVGKIGNYIAHPEDANEVNAKAVEIARAAAPYLEKGAALYPPGYAPLACAVTAILHGMLGYPPRILWSCRPKNNSRFLVSSKFMLDLQALRDQGNRMRPRN
jgi:hypothetical protein